MGELRNKVNISAVSQVRTKFCSGNTYLLKHQVMFEYSYVLGMKDLLI